MERCRRVLSRVSPTILLVFILGLPLISTPYGIHIAIMAAINLVVALGLAVLFGFAGQISFGQAGFFGIGAYLSAYVSARLGVPVAVSMLLATTVTGVSGLLLAIPTLKVSGLYLTLVSLGFGEIVRSVLINWRAVTGGTMGFRGIQPPSVFGLCLDTPVLYYYLAVVSVALALMVVMRVLRSPIGTAFITVCDDEVAGAACGVDVSYFKMLAFVMSAAFAGLGGSLFAHYVGFLHPDSFTFAFSLSAVVNVVVGGRRSIPGVVLATIVLTVAMEALRAVQEYRLICHAAILILSMVFLPEGLGGLAAWTGKRLWGEAGKGRTATEVGGGEV